MQTAEIFITFLNTTDAKFKKELSSLAQKENPFFEKSLKDLNEHATEQEDNELLLSQIGLWVLVNFYGKSLKDEYLKLAPIVGKLLKFFVDDISNTNK